MIDWISAVFPVDVEINGGRCVHVTPGGEVEWETPKFMVVEGSYSARVSVKSIWDTGSKKLQTTLGANLGATIYPYKLYVSGNPTKFLQGHNIFGVNDLHGIMTDFITLLCKSLGFNSDITDRMIQLTVSGKYEITRIDLTESFILPSIGDVRAWIRAASQVGTGRNQAVNSYKERTLYLGKNSRRMSIKIYAKGDEIQKHKLPYHFDSVSDKLQEYADKLLRVEVTLRSMALKDCGLHKGMFWRHGMIEDLFNDKIKKLELPENTSMSAIDILALPQHLQGYLALWQSGHNLKEHVSKPTFYRVRTELKKYGVDIKSPPAGQKSNVVPLIKVITAVPALIPDFAYECNLVHIPVKRFG